MTSMTGLSPVGLARSGTSYTYPFDGLGPRAEGPELSACSGPGQGLAILLARLDEGAVEVVRSSLGQ